MVENRKKRLAEFKSRHQFWSNDEVKILTDLWLQDVPAAYISKVLKRSGNAIEVKALRLGLASRRNERKLVRNAKGQKARVRPCLNCRTLFFRWVLEIVFVPIARNTPVGNRVPTFT